MLDLQGLTADGSQFVKKLRDYFLTIGESTIELTTTLVVMVLVERFYDQHGLGVYAYLLSLLFIASYISEFGIPRFAVVKHKLPGSWKTWIGFSSVRSTLIQGYRYLFTDDALDTEYPFKSLPGSLCRHIPRRQRHDDFYAGLFSGI